MSLSIDDRRAFYKQLLTSSDPVDAAERHRRIDADPVLYAVETLDAVQADDELTCWALANQELTALWLEHLPYLHTEIPNIVTRRLMSDDHPHLSPGEHLGVLRAFEQNGLNGISERKNIFTRTQHLVESTRANEDKAFLTQILLAASRIKSAYTVPFIYEAMLVAQSIPDHRLLADATVRLVTVFSDLNLPASANHYIADATRLLANIPLKSPLDAVHLRSAYYLICSIMEPDRYIHYCDLAIDMFTPLVHQYPGQFDRPLAMWLKDSFEKTCDLSSPYLYAFELVSRTTFPRSKLDPDLRLSVIQTLYNAALKEFCHFQIDPGFDPSRCKTPAIVDAMLNQIDHVTYSRFTRKIDSPLNLPDDLVPAFTPARHALLVLKALFLGPASLYDAIADAPLHVYFYEGEISDFWALLAHVMYVAAPPDMPLFRACCHHLASLRQDDILPVPETRPGYRDYIPTSFWGEFVTDVMAATVITPDILRTFKILSLSVIERSRQTWPAPITGPTLSYR